MSRNPLRIGSLFTGTGALDLAVMDVFDAEVVWHSQYEPPDKNGKEDTNQYAAKILARHWPDVPNLWDITKVDWQAVLKEYGPVDVLTGGFPCQDVSSAGKRAGLTADSRSGLWTHFAHAIHELNPRLVVIENVEGLLLLAQHVIAAAFGIPAVASDGSTVAA
jgi:DNA (cytosine-5)-methyltransferase 1